MHKGSRNLSNLTYCIQLTFAIFISFVKLWAFRTIIFLINTTFTFLCTVTFARTISHFNLIFAIYSYFLAFFFAWDFLFFYDRDMKFIRNGLIFSKNPKIRAWIFSHYAVNLWIHFYCFIKNVAFINLNFGWIFSRNNIKSRTYNDLDWRVWRESIWISIIIRNIVKWMNFNDAIWDGVDIIPTSWNFKLKSWDISLKLLNGRYSIIEKIIYFEVSVCSTSCKF